MLYTVVEKVYENSNFVEKFKMFLAFKCEREA